MKFKDEEILAMMQELEKQTEPRSIEQGTIRIGNEEYKFEERAFFDEALWVLVPDSFQPMPLSMQKLKYPYEQRPEIVLTNADGTVNLTFTRVDQPLQDEWVEELMIGMKNMLRKMSPSNVFYEQKVEDVRGKKIGYFDFKSPAMDEPLYQLMFYLELSGETLMGSFNCPYRQYKDWRDIAVQIVHSIRTPDLEVVEEEAEGANGEKNAAPGISTNHNAVKDGIDTRNNSHAKEGDYE